MTAKKTTWASFLDSLNKAFKTRDEAAFNEALEKGSELEPDEDGPNGKTDVHVHLPSTAAPTHDEEMPSWFGEHKKTMDNFMEKMDKRVGDMETTIKELRGTEHGSAEPNKEIEGVLREMAPPGTGDAAIKSRDSAYLGEAFAETVALAEILAPGISLPTYDRAAAPKTTVDAVCSLQRRALDAAYLQPSGRVMLDGLLGGRPLKTDGLSCSEVRGLFRQAGVTRRMQNSAGMFRTGDGGAAPTPETRDGPRSIADLNELNRKFYQTA